MDKLQLEKVWKSAKVDSQIKEKPFEVGFSTFQIISRAIGDGNRICKHLQFSSSKTIVKYWIEPEPISED